MPAVLYGAPWQELPIDRKTFLDLCNKLKELVGPCRLCWGMGWGIPMVYPLQIDIDLVSPSQVGDLMQKDFRYKERCRMCHGSGLNVKELLSWLQLDDARKETRHV